MTIDDLPKQYSPTETEAKWQKIWEGSGIFTAQSPSDRPNYTVMIPPPNVTGSLHMGHAFEEAIIDTLVRYHRMSGFNTLWLPGIDHASIAVQTILEKQLKAEGLKKDDLGREKFLERAWAWKAESGGTITHQIRKLGASVDWSRERFTLDAGLSKAVIEAFVRLYEDDLIYRGEYLVNWCPASQSAVSDLEVDLQETKGHLWHFRYPIKDSNEYLVVATTRPETMLGDTAVAVNPEDERYLHLIGKTILLPILNREIPIVGDIYVDRSFGTGCVKVTPAHDFNDFEIGKRHNLPSINILNKDGTINESGAEFEGCDRFVARKRVVAKLEELGLLEKIEDYTHNVPYSERGKVPVEPFLSTQWFVKIRPLADFTLDKYDRENSPRFIPDRWGKVYRDWLVKLKDWCISRQLWWGHQIPAWYDSEGNIYVARSKEEALSQAKTKTGMEINLEQDPDVLDTWFSSGLWCFSTLGWDGNSETEDFKTFYPTSTLVTGFDIIFFWVARMTMMSGYFTGKMPFKDVYIHGLIRDENNQKMSKSKNNGIDPLVLIAKYGTDALRYSLVKEVIGAGQDVRMDYNRKTDESATVEAARNFANKLWNASRFVLMNLAEDVDFTQGSGASGLELSDRWIISRFHGTAKEINNLLQNYSLGEGAKLLYEFIWGDFCDYYIELVKPRLLADSNSKLTAQRVLIQILDGILRLLHPYMPHITEEIWQTLPTNSISETPKYLALQSYPQADSTKIDLELETQFSSIFEVIRVIRNLRADADVKPGIKVKAILQSESESDRLFLNQTLTYIENLAKAEQIEVVAQIPTDLGQVASGVAGTVQILIPLAGAVDLGQLEAKLKRSLEKIEAAFIPIQTRLANPGYVQKAPPEVIAKAKAELEELSIQRETLRSRLLAISSQISNEIASQPKES
jgi:valyl-tRNA synthetase